MHLNSLATALSAGYVLRAHTVPAVLRHTVGLHTYRALIILHWLYDRETPPAHLTQALLYHDIAEVFTGDMPGDFKAAYSHVSQALKLVEDQFEHKHEIYVNISPEEARQLCFCDRADLALWAMDELKAGNTFFEPILTKACEMMRVELGKYAMCSAYKDQVLERMNILMNIVIRSLPGE